MSVTEQEPVPPAPVAVPVYVRVKSGATFVDPDAETYPTLVM